MINELHIRLRRIRANRAILAWEYRQRRHSKGVWNSLRRVLADAESAWAIPCDEAERLEREGFHREVVGAELHPEKFLIFIPRWRLEKIAERARLKMRLDTEFFAAPCIALLHFAKEKEGRGTAEAENP